MNVRTRSIPGGFGRAHRRETSDRPRRYRGRVVGAASAGLATVVAGVVLAAPAAHAATFAGYEIAFVGTDTGQWTLDPGGAAHNTGVPVLAGQRPAVAGLSGGGYVGFFVSTDATLWRVDSAGHSSVMTAAPCENSAYRSSQSPTVAAGANNSWQAGFIAGQLNKIKSPRDPGGCAVSPVTPLLSTTSAPSVAAITTGNAEYVFVTSDNTLWRSDDGTTSAVPGNLCVSPGTSPAIAPDTSGGWEVAYTGCNGDLWTIDSALHLLDTHFVPQAGTSPAIARLTTGGYEIALTGADGFLWQIDPGNHGHPSGPPSHLVPQPGTSPAIAADFNGGFRIALHGANTNHLWTVDANQAAGDTGQVLNNGTSPAITALTAGSGNPPPPPPTTPPPTTPPPTGPPPLPQLKSYTVENCDADIATGDGTFGPSMVIWGRDATANAAFTQMGVLSGQVPPSFCPDPATFIFNPITGHTYQLRVIEVGGVASICPNNLPTACIRDDFTFQGNPNGTARKIRITVG